MFFSLIVFLMITGIEPSNSVCPVEPWVKVTEKTRRVVEARGRQYRVCCASCVKKLNANPDQYIDEVGAIKPAIKPPKKKKSSECAPCKF